MPGPPNPSATPTASRESGLADLGAAFSAALAVPDVRGAHALVAEAAAAGASPGALYVQVVRPALAALQQADRDVRARLAAGIGESILADLVAALPLAGASGARRAAVLSCRDHGIEGVDGSAAIDFLEADGWEVDRLGADVSLDDFSRVAPIGIELAVAITAGPQDALALARACTELRRLPDPPVIVLCDFSRRAGHRAAAMALGADAVAADPEELVAHARQRLPAAGQRRWGVALSRSGATLSLAPIGCLDTVSVARLTDVAVSRQGTFTRLVLDLRDVAQFEPAGLRQLIAWSSLPALSGVELTVVASPGARAELTAAPSRLRVVATAHEAAQAAAL